MDHSSSSSDTPSEDSLFSRAQAGDQAAWAALFAKCYPKIRRVVRRRLTGSLRRYIDSTDVASDVLGQLALKSATFRFETLEALKDYLIVAAHQRVVDEHRRQVSKKRDVHRERPMGDRGQSDAWAISSGEPTPSEHAVARETHEMLRNVSGDEAGRLVIELRGENRDSGEITRATGWSIRRVQRFLKDLRPSFLHY